MPGLAILPAARPHPFAGQNAAAFVKIFETLGQFEGMRQKRMMSSDILSILSQGGGVEDIAGVVQAHQRPQFDTGLQGLLQRIAAPFAQAPGAGITDMMLKETMESAFKTISPSQQITQFRLQNINRLKAKPERTAEEEAELKRLIGPTPLVQIGQKLLSEEERIAQAKREHEKAMADKSFGESDIRYFHEDMRKIIGATPKTDIKGRIRNVHLQRSILKEYIDLAQMRGYSAWNKTQQEQFDKVWDREVARLGKPRKERDNQGNVVTVGWNPNSAEVKQARKQLRKETAVEEKFPSKTSVKGMGEAEAKRRVLSIWALYSEDVRKAIEDAVEMGFSYLRILETDEVREALEKQR